MNRTVTPPSEPITLAEDTNYAELVRALMDNSGVTVAELSRRIGNSQNLISMWRWGKRAPSVLSLARIADALGFDLTLTPKAASAEVPAPAPKPVRSVLGCPASVSGLCLSMTEGYAVCEPGECVHHESGQRACAHPFHDDPPQGEHYEISSGDMVITGYRCPACGFETVRATP